MFVVKTLRAQRQWEYRAAKATLLLTTAVISAQAAAQNVQPPPPAYATSQANASLGVGGALVPASADVSALPGESVAGAGATSQPRAASGEIVVTAQKRVERLQDVPISVSVLGGDAIQKDRIGRADDLVSKVANLQLLSTVGQNTPIFSLRGVSMYDYSLNQSGPIATYYDEVYKGNFAFLGVSMYDLDRVEVLRGPQGTLYGKNTTGGAINFISKAPELGSLNGYLTLGYGNYNRVEGNGAINLPISDTLAARIAFTAARADGWYRNLMPGKPDLAGVSEYGIRASLRWEPAAGTSFILRASTSYQDPRNYGVYAQPTADGIGAGVYEAFGQGGSYFRTGLAPRQIEADYTPRRIARTYSLALTSTFDVGGGLSVTSVTSWDKGVLHFGEDTDGSPLKTLEVYYGDRGTQFAEDLRFTSNWDGRFNFILGAYFNKENIFNTTDFGIYKDIDVNGDGVVNVADCVAGMPVACDVVNRFDQIKRSYAIYADAHYDLGGGFTLRGGVRYTIDKGLQKNLISQALGVDGLLASTIIPMTSLRFSNDNVSGKIGLDYKPNADTLLYASYSRGYRAPSFNGQALFDPGEVSVVKPEELDSFEIGSKLQFWDRRITLNSAAFYYIYRNQQMLNLNPDNGVQTLINVDRSRIYGLEADLTARVAPVLNLRFGMGLLSAKVMKGYLSGVDLRGKHMVTAPSVSLNGGFDLTLLARDGVKVSLHPDVSYVSKQYFKIFNYPGLNQNGYALVNGHIDIERGRYTLAMWVKNLTGKDYYTVRSPVTGFGFIYNQLGDPRTFGGTIGVKF